MHHDAALASSGGSTAPLKVSTAGQRAGQAAVPHPEQADDPSSDDHRTEHVHVGFKVVFDARL